MRAFVDLDVGRVEEDLRGVISGEVLCDPASRAVYATDASLLSVTPLAVVRPRSTADVAAVVRWAAEHDCPVHARGGGTSLCGGPLGPGIVIDLSRSMRRILRTGPDSVRVQAGVVCEQVRQHLARFGRVLGPDPATEAVTTIGGMIGRDTSGSRYLRHGSMRRWVAACEVVLADGTVVELGGEEPAGGSLAAIRTGRLAEEVHAILTRAREVIRDGQPASRPLHGGYRLHDLMPDPAPDAAPAWVTAAPPAVDLVRLMCGAEGTLGIVTEATLLTAAEDAATRVAFLFFESLDRAAIAASRLLEYGPNACDIFDKRHLTLARASSPALESLVPRAAEACLLVEFSGAEPAEAAGRLEAAVARVESVERLATTVRRAADAEEAALYWSLARNVVPTLHRLLEGRPALPWVEDVALPPLEVPEFLRRLPSVLRQAGLSAMLFGHAGHGEMHLRPFVDLRDAAEAGSLERLADGLYELVASLGGTIGAEQGLGLGRTRAFSTLFPRLAEVFGEIKTAFDPQVTLNPGRVVGGAARPLSEARRPDLPRATENASPPAAGQAGLLPQLEACNGCGSCRGQSPGGRMCPVFRAGQIEEASPRAKANLLSAVLSGRLDGKALETDAARALSDLCFNCHQCRRECDAAVDIPRIVAELKAAHVAACGLPLSRWVLSRVDLVSALGGRFRGLANALIANPQFRWLLEKSVGIAQGRKLPPLAGGQFLRWAARRGLTRPPRHGGERVMIFLDTYARRHDPTLAQALVTILEHNGIGVFVDPRQVSSGMPMVAEGDLDAARRQARTNLRILSEAVRHGYRIVSTEPSAVTCIAHDYPLLLDDEEAVRVADNTSDATAFLWNLHREGRLRLDLEPISANLLYHAPCHVRLRGGSPAESLLGLIPGLSIQARDLGCSGMAGTFGLAREHYRTSLRIGLALVSAMRDPRIAAGVTECSGCRIQMEQGTTKPTVHPLKLLARSYRCLDGLDSLLAASSGRLVTS